MELVGLFIPLNKKGLGVWSRAGPLIAHTAYALIHSPSQFWPTSINTLQDMDMVWRISGTIPKSQQFGHKVNPLLTSQSSIFLQHYLSICCPKITLRILCPDTWHTSGYVCNTWAMGNLGQVLCRTDAVSFCHLASGPNSWDHFYKEARIF